MSHVLAGAQVATTVRAFGQRKQRRFENDLFSNAFTGFGDIPRAWGMAAFNPTMAAICAQLEAMDIIEQVELVDSVFAQLKKSDAALLEAFFEGECIAVPPKSRARTNKALIGDDDALTKRKSRTHQGSFEAAYNRIDKKARRHLPRAVGFVSQIEEIVLEKSKIIDCGNVERTTDGKHEIVFVSLESAFLRMLAHAIAQFYNIPSRTIFSDRGQTQVRFSLNKNQVKGASGLRLSEYLLKQHAR